MEFQNKNQVVERLIREAIARGDIRPGERLLQLELAKKLGISSTPIREALRALQAQGIVVHEPNKGVRVADVRPEEATEIYLIREVLEALATEQATSRLSPDALDEVRSLHEQMAAAVAAGKLVRLRRLNHAMHFAIYRAAGLTRLAQMIELLWTLFPWDTLYVIPGRAQASVREHEEILRALESQDAAAAGEAVRRHIRAGCQAVMEYIATHPPERRTLSVDEDEGGDQIG